MSYKSAVPEEEQDDKLLSNTFIILFGVVTVILAYLLFPSTSLRHILITQPQAHPVSIFYLEHYEAEYPRDSGVAVALTRQLIDQNFYESAQKQIDRLNANAETTTEAKILVFRMNYTKAFQLSAGEKRTKAFDEIKKQFTEIIKLKLTPEQMLWLAKIALSINEPQAALVLYEQYVAAMPKESAELYREIAVTALQTDQQAISARYYLLASEADKTLDQKRIDIISALNVLRQGNLLNQSVVVINQLPENVINNRAMLIYLTRYVLSAGRPDLADRFIKRALLTEGKAE